MNSIGQQGLGLLAFYISVSFKEALEYTLIHVDAHLWCSLKGVLDPLSQQLQLITELSQDIQDQTSYNQK